MANFTDRFIELPVVTVATVDLDIMGSEADERIEIIKISMLKIDAYRSDWYAGKGVYRSVIQVNGVEVYIDMDINSLESKLNSFDRGQ